MKQIDFAKLLNLPADLPKPKPLVPGEYAGFLQHNEAGYWLEVIGPDGVVRKLPVRLRP